MTGQFQGVTTFGSTSKGTISTLGVYIMRVKEDSTVSWVQLMTCDAVDSCHAFSCLAQVPLFSTQHQFTHKRGARFTLAVISWQI